MDWTGREVLAGSNRRNSPTPSLLAAGGPALPYLGGRVRGRDGRVLQSSRRRLHRGATAAGLRLGGRPAPRLRLLRAPLLRRAPSTHGFSAVLPRPATGLRLLQIAGTPGRARSRAPARSQERLPLLLLLRTRPDCECRRRARGKLLKRKKKKATSLPPPPPCFSLASSHEHSPDTPFSSISPQAAKT